MDALGAAVAYGKLFKSLKVFLRILQSFPPLIIITVINTLTRAPITPKLVNRKYSNGRVFETVCKNGYKNNGTWASRKCDRVSGWEATHCSKANALHTL